MPRLVPGPPGILRGLVNLLAGKGKTCFVVWLNKLEPGAVSYDPAPKALG